MNGRNWVLLILFIVFLGVVWWLLRNSRREDDADLGAPMNSRAPGDGIVPVGSAAPAPGAGADLAGPGTMAAGAAAAGPGLAAPEPATVGPPSAPIEGTWGRPVTPREESTPVAGEPPVADEPAAADAPAADERWWEKDAAAEPAPRVWSAADVRPDEVDAELTSLETESPREDSRADDGPTEAGVAAGDAAGQTPAGDLDDRDRSQREMSDTWSERRDTAADDLDRNAELDRSDDLDRQADLLDSADLTDSARRDAELSGAVTDGDPDADAAYESVEATSEPAPEEQVIVHWDGVEGTAEDPDADVAADATGTAPAVADGDIEVGVPVERADMAADDASRDESAEEVGAPAAAAGLAGATALGAATVGQRAEDDRADTASSAAADPVGILAESERVEVVAEGEGLGAPDWHPSGVGSEPAATEPHDHAVWDGGWGVGSAAPNDDGCMPLGHPIKGVFDYGRVYQVPGSDWYDATVPDVWFVDEESAQRAGFRRGEG